jgi:hypothetical protein
MLLSPTPASRSEGRPWDRLAMLVDRASSVSALREHRVNLFAARCWREVGRDVPDELRSDERTAAIIALCAQPVLRRMRLAYDGTLMLMKGPEAAAHHLHPETRYFRDLDVLVDDPVAAQQALLAAGFVQAGGDHAYAEAQHLAPLVYPGFPLLVELHRRPNIPPWLPAPWRETILEMAVPSRTGVAGIVAPAPPAHALLLAAHSWTDRPVGRLIDLVDLIAVLGEAHREEADRLSHEWGWQRLWRATILLADAVLAGEGAPKSLRTWARHFQSARERTVLENHIARAASRAWVVPRAGVRTALATTVAQTAGRRPDEDWGQKVRRSRLAVRHAFTAQSTHHEALHSKGATDDNPTAER